MNSFPQTPRNRVRRLAKRASYDKDLIYQIIDAARICHVGFVEGRQPFVIPTIHVRRGDELLLHGAKASRLLRYVASGKPLCVAITLLDGLVLARAVFHNSMNYRSVVLFGRGRLIEAPEEKWRALEALTERVMPGRWTEARRPNRKELNATHIVSVAIESASAKVRTGPPADDKADYALPIWAGVIPVMEQLGTPVADPQLRNDIPVPPYLARYARG